MPNIVKTTTIFNPFELLAPHSCRGCGYTGSILCDCCKNNIISHHHNLCPFCKEPCPAGLCAKCPPHPPIYIADERSSLIGELIHDYKFHSIRALATPLADILHHILPPIDTEVAIVPLPTISQHIRTRGFDHTLLIAKKLAHLRGRSYRIEKALLRAHNTVQVGATKAARLAQAEHSYRINPKFTPKPNTTYLLLDDVWTTGASMHSALTKLQAAGAKQIIISILALSRFDRPS